MKLNCVSIVALHGFLGLPTSWDSLLGKKSACRIYPNLYEDYPITDCKTWSKNFNADMREKILHFDFKILVGYSLGGRLALHALVDNPEMWDAAIIISAHYGVTDVTQKQKRLEEDHLWAKRIESLPWNEFMNLWNSRDVFLSDSLVYPRNECDYNKKKLSDALKIWSLGTQDCLQNSIKCLKMPIFWVVGENDESYVQKALHLELSHPKSKIVKVKNAGHRSAINNVQQLAEEIYDIGSGKSTVENCKEI